VRKPTLPEMAAAYGLRGLERELKDPCEALQLMIGNAVPAPVGDAFVAKVLLDRERGVQQPQCREPFIQGWATVFPAPEPQRLPPAESQELPRALRSGGRDRAQMAIKGTDTPKKPSRGIEKLVNGLGLVNTDLLRRVRQHAGDVMRSGISC
jgi:hypothetical protein